MQLNKKGFVWLPVLLAILAILAVSGGAYWYVQHKAPIAVQKQPTQSSPLTFSVTQASGSTPLSLWFTAGLQGGGRDNKTYKVDTGDGKTLSMSWDNGKGTPDTWSLGVYYTYSKPGSYTPILYADGKRVGDTTVTVIGSQADTMDWKTYSNNLFSVRYPIAYTFSSSLCLGDCNSYYAKGSSAEYVSITAEKVQGDGCYFLLCNTPAKDQETFNSVSWNYLGLQSYGDVGQSGSFYAYRTTYGQYRYYVLFKSDTPENKIIMQSLRFTAVQ